MNTEKHGLKNKFLNLRPSALIRGSASFANSALGFFYPEICQLCQTERATKENGFVCSNCWQQVRFIRPPFCDRCGLPFEGDITTKFECANCREMELHFSSARSAVVAKTAVLEIIHRYKYSRQLWFEPFLADLLLCPFHFTRPKNASANSIRRNDWQVI